MIFKEYDLLARKEGMDNLDLFIRDYETFDEIPLLSREQHLKIMDGLFASNLIQDALINLSWFYLNNICFHAKSKLDEAQFDNFFACLTFDLSDKDFWGFYVPSILVTRKISLFKFVLDLEKNSSSGGKSDLFSSFVNLGLENSFVFCRSTDNKLSDISRQYAIQNAHFERLRLV